MRIAYFSPLPPQKSGIADYSVNLLPALLHHWDVTLFVEQPNVELRAEIGSLAVRSIDSFRGLIDEQYDMCVYQMGNNIRYHRKTYETLLRYPGIVVLHDPNLHAFHLDYAMQQQCPISQLVRDLGFAYGSEGVEYARQLLSDGGPRQDEMYPLSARIAQVSIGVIVHSEHARQMVLRDFPCAQVVVTQQPVPLARRLISKSHAKKQLGLPEEAVLISSFGYASPNKHIHSVIEVLPKLRESFPAVHYAIVGQPIAGYELAQHISVRDLTQFVHLTGYVDETTYTQYLLATDIGVNLRFPTTGETSAALLSMMAAGIPCIVADVDAFSELPDEAVVKLKPDVSLDNDLLLALTALLNRPEWQASLSDGASHYIASQANPAVVAAKYANSVTDFVHRSYDGASLRLSL